jgi:hypothetical protein
LHRLAAVGRPPQDQGGNFAIPRNFDFEVLTTLPAFFKDASSWGVDLFDGDGILAPA